MSVCDYSGEDFTSDEEIYTPYIYEIFWLYDHQYIYGCDSAHLRVGRGPGPSTDLGCIFIDVIVSYPWIKFTVP